MRILSPKSAPPVFLFEGSTEIIPMVFSGKSTKNLRTNSSTKLDFPEPPVPVIPRTTAPPNLTKVEEFQSLLKIFSNST